MRVRIASALTVLMMAASPAVAQQLKLDNLNKLSDAARQVVEDAQHLSRVRTAADDALLRLAQLRRRDHLHGLRDLLRRLDRADAPTNVDQ